MIRSSRLRAAILAALFAAILTTTAYAGVTRCHRTVNGTKFNDLERQRPARLRRAGARGLAHLGGLRRRRRPRHRRALRRHGLPRPLLARRHHDHGVPPARAAPRRRQRRLEALVPERLHVRRLRLRQGRRLRLRLGPDHLRRGQRQGLRQLQAAEDHRHQEARPRERPRALRPQGRQHGGQGGGRRRREREHPRQPGRAPGRARPRRPAPTWRTTAHRSPATRRPRRPTGRAGSTRSRAMRSPARSPTPASARSRSPRSPTRTRRAARSSASPASRARSTCPTAA